MFDTEFDGILVDDPDEFGYCVICGEKFPKEDLNDRGECEEHKGETIFSKEELEDYLSLLKNINKY